MDQINPIKSMQTEDTYFSKEIKIVESLEYMMTD